MKKIKCFFILGLCFVMKIYAQPSTGNLVDLIKEKKDTVLGWKFSGIYNLNFSQSQYFNWASGGQNSININSLLSLNLQRLWEKSWFENQLDLAYGILSQQGQGIRKTDDKIEFLSRFGYRAFKNGYYAFLLNFRTQFAPGYNYPNDSVKISDFFAPAYIMGALGINYGPDKNITIFAAPLTTKITIVRDTMLANQGAFGVRPAEYDGNGQLLQPGQNIRYEIGGYIRIASKKEIMENVVWQIRSDFFSNYLNNPQNIDINAESIFNFKINKFLSASLSIAVIYDDDIIIKQDTNDDGIIDKQGPRTQFKEVFGLGVNYKF
ncbi:MAG: hypothetical protein KatS3mg034_0554 [Vicingaceae bacterium]|nr:MAG: hypothetical protein KatS3mg034_0554 [Vicingaceae bacterium]